MKWKRAFLSSLKLAVSTAAGLLATISATGWNPRKWEDWTPVLAAMAVKFLWKFGELMPEE